MKKLMKKLLRIAVYIRVSTEEQAALVDGSLDNQRYRINAFIDLKNVQESGWGKAFDYYVDDGYSAKDTRRPAFQRMIADLKRGKIDLILVTDLSRLSRNISDFSELLETLKEYEASFLSIKEQFDTSTPAGKMMVYNMINLAQFEREQTAERVTLGCHARAMRGLLNGGHAILGLDKSEEKKGSYVVNEDEAVDVKTIFTTFLECGTISRTIKKLEELGISPKVKNYKNTRLVDRGFWTVSTLGELLRNYAYVGKREVNRDNKNSDSHLLKPHQKYQVVRASWPAIVDEKTFESVQKLLQENREMERRRLDGAERRVFLVSGIIHCKECGRPMVGQSSHGHGKVHRYYKHSSSRGDVIDCSVKRIRADEVEDLIAKHISGMLRDGKYLDDVAKNIARVSKDAAAGQKSTRTKLEKEQATILVEMEKAFRLQLDAAQGSEASKFLIAKLESLGQRKTSVEKQLESFVETPSNVISFAGVRNDLEARVEAVNRGWGKMPAAQRRRALRRLIQRLNIGPGVLDLYYYSNALASESSLGVLSMESESVAKVLPFGSQGTRSRGSKLKGQSCPMKDMVNQARQYPNNYIPLISLSILS